MLGILITWVIIGIVVFFLKIRQLRQHGFGYRITFDTLPLYFAISVVLWPLVIYFIYREKKTHERLRYLAQMEKSEFDRELDEIERELDEDEIERM